MSQLFRVQMQIIVFLNPGINPADVLLAESLFFPSYPVCMHSVRPKHGHTQLQPQLFTNLPTVKAGRQGRQTEILILKKTIYLTTTIKKTLC